jgi:methyltransferase (TIGR00027 family)
LPVGYLVLSVLGPGGGSRVMSDGLVTLKRMSRPSITGQVVALTRAELDRPHSADGDPDAQRRLCEGLTYSPPGWLQPSIAARTSFLDEQVTRAIAAGIRQIVTCGAGYDDRALRFRTRSVRFFELDHPVTQADKAARLRAVGAADAVTLAGADFRTDDAGSALASAGHDAAKPSLFICEGLLVYLDRGTCHRLLSALSARAAGTGVLAASLSTHADGFDSAEVVAAANRSRGRTAEIEPWQTILPVAEHLRLLADAGWRVTTRRWSPASAVDPSHGRRGLLVQASPAAS